MRLFGLEITRQKDSGLITHLPERVGGGWFGTIRESFAGAWQRNITVNNQEVLRYGTVWACITLIASDIAKLWIDLVEHDDDGIATAINSPAFSPVLRKPNHYQTRVKFFEHWMISKLTNGNAYILKERDKRGVVVALYVLDPCRVQVLVGPDGAVYYELSTDYLSGLAEPSVQVPASEIMHDICVPLYHPLCGVSPIYACGLAAMQGLKIQQQSSSLFANGAQLSGVLTAPGVINKVTADRIQNEWEQKYAGEQNSGKVAVLGDGLHFEPMVMTAVDAQLIDQLKWTSENICACFHVPGYMVGIGPAPPYTDIQSMNLQYYTQALQNPIENIEALLEEGLSIPAGYGIEFDLDALVRMDSKSQMEIATKGVTGSIFSPNEARAKFNMPPVPGGASPLAQQQMYSLEALSQRDLAAPPPASPAIGGAPPAEAPPAEDPVAKALAPYLPAMAAARLRQKLVA